MIPKTTTLAKQGHQDAFANLVSFAAIVMVFVHEIASSLDRAGERRVDYSLRLGDDFVEVGAALEALRVDLVDVLRP